MSLTPDLIVGKQWILNIGAETPDFTTLLSSMITGATDMHSGILPVNAHAEVKILNLNLFTALYFILPPRNCQMELRASRRQNNSQTKLADK